MIRFLMPARPGRTFAIALTTLIILPLFGNRTAHGLSRPAVREAAGQWTQMPASGFGFDHGMHGIVGIGAKDAWAVGATIDHWNGQRWTEVKGGVIGANPNGEPLRSIAKIPNTSPTQLLAVGSYAKTATTGQVARIQRYNGHAWSLMPYQAPAQSVLNSVSAVSSTNAWAVGEIDGSPRQPLIIHWNGTKWASVSPPALGVTGVLDSVLAMSPSSVWAVGSYQTAGYVNEPVIEKWDGAKWSVVSSPPAAGSELTSLTAIPGGGMWAAGTTETATGQKGLFERYSGNAWSVAASSGETRYGNLTSVAASSPNSAWAVGATAEQYHGTWIEHWNGSIWKTVASPKPPNGSDTLDAVAMLPGSGEGLAVGGQMLHLSGSAWSPVSAPNIGAFNPISSLATVPGKGTVRAWAVGTESAQNTRDNATMLTYNGTSWKTTHIPEPGRADDLRSVDALTAGNAWAVGGQSVKKSGSLVSQTLILHYTGSAWKLVNSPNPASYDTLEAVDAVGAKSVWVAGYSDDAGNSASLVLHWNGAVWTPILCPNPSPSTRLVSMSALNDMNVWFAGSYNANSTSHVLIEHWNGSKCTVQPAIDPASASTELRSIYARTPSDVWAVGEENNGANNSGFVEHWNGATWTVVPAPGPSKEAGFYTVFASGPQDAWIGGSYAPGHVMSEDGVVEHWNGSKWSIDPSPLFPVPGRSLSQITHGPGGAGVWAAGSAPNKYGASQPFFARHG